MLNVILIQFLDSITIYPFLNAVWKLYDICNYQLPRIGVCGAQYLWAESYRYFRMPEKLTCVHPNFGLNTRQAILYTPK